MDEGPLLYHLSRPGAIRGTNLILIPSALEDHRTGDADLQCLPVSLIRLVEEDLWVDATIGAACRLPHPGGIDLRPSCYSCVSPRLTFDGVSSSEASGEA